MGPVAGFFGAIIFGVGAGASLAYTVAVGLARLAVLSLISRALTPKIDLSQTAADKMLTVKSTIQPQAFVVGQDMLSGPLIFAQVENDKSLHRAIALTGRELDSFVAFRFDDTDITIPADIPDASDTITAGLYADVVDIDTRTGTSTQTAIAALTTAFPTFWTSAHRARGWSLLSTKMTVKGNNDAFENGFPQNLRALVKGHKIYDPRLDSTRVIDSTTSPVTNGSGAHRVDTPSTWAWSDNPALHLADFFMWQQVGMGESEDRVDWELVAAAADRCDELVEIPPVASPANTQKRYTANFTFYSDQAREQVKQTLEQAMLGRSIYSQGKWRMWAGGPLTPTIALTEANLGAGAEVTIEASTGSKQRYNRVRGKFVDPTRNYSANPYPERTNSAYETEDAGIKYETVDFNAANNSYECQRDAEILLRKTRYQNVIEWVGNWSCFRIQPGHVVEVNFSELNWSATASPATTKKFFVSNWVLRKDGSGVTLTLAEENDAIWVDLDPTDYTTRTPTGELVPPASAAVRLSDADIHNERSSASCFAGITLENAGRLKYSDAAGIFGDAAVPEKEWRAYGTAEYWARCSVNSGSLDVGTADTWQSLATSREFSIEQDSSGTNNANITIEIAADDAGATVLATADFDLEATVTTAFYTLRDVGTMLISESSSAAAVNKPSSIGAGDLLVLAIATSYHKASPLTTGTGANWTQSISNDITDSRIQVFFRYATGDSDDDATLVGPFATQVRIAQMAVFTGSVYAGTIASITDGTDVLDNSTESTFSYPSLSSGSLTNTLGLIASHKKTTDTSDGSSVSDEAGITIIGQGLSDFDQGEDIRMVWGFSLLPSNSDELSGAWDVSASESSRVDGVAGRFKSSESA